MLFNEIQGFEFCVTLPLPFQGHYSHPNLLMWCNLPIHDFLLVFNSNMCFTMQCKPCTTFFHKGNSKISEQNKFIYFVRTILTRN